MRVEILNSKLKLKKHCATLGRLAILNDLMSQVSDPYILGELRAVAYRINRKQKSSPLTPKKNKDNKARRAVIQGNTARTSSNKGQQWVAKDDLEVLNSTDTDEQIALRIGRTLRAVEGRRVNLRKLQTPANHPGQASTLDAGAENE